LDVEKLRHVVPQLLPGFDAMVEEITTYATLWLKCGTPDWP